MVHPLVVDVARSQATTLRRRLRHLGLDACIARGRREALRKIRSGQFDSIWVVVDPEHTGADLRLIDRLRLLSPEVPIVRVGGGGMAPERPDVLGIESADVTGDLDDVLAAASARVHHDRRGDGRSPVDLDAILGGRGIVAPGRIVDLSRGGALVSLESVASEMGLDLALDVPPFVELRVEDLDLWVRAQVAHCEPRIRHVGLTFLDALEIEEIEADEVDELEFDDVLA